MKTNFMHYLSPVYFVNQSLHISGVFAAHHQEVYCSYIYNNWYVLRFSVDCLLAGRQANSQLKSTKRTSCCIYTGYLLMMGYKYAQNM